MINITTDWIAVIPPEDKRIGYVGEHISDSRQFFLSDMVYRDYEFYLDIAFDLSTVTELSPPRTIKTTQQESNEIVDPSGSIINSTANTSSESYTQQEVKVDCEASTDVVPLSKWEDANGITLTWSVRNQHTRLPGVLRATLRAVSPRGNIKKSAMMLFTVSPAVEATPAAPIPLSEHEQMEQAMVAALEQAAADTYANFQKTVEDTCAEVEQVAENTYANFQKTVEDASAEVKQVAEDTYANFQKTVEDTSAEVKQVAENTYANFQKTVEDASADVERVASGSYAAFEECLENTVGDVEQIKDYVDSKTAPAKLGTTGTVKLGADAGMTGLAIGANGDLTIRAADKTQIDGEEYGPNMAIVVRNLNYAVKSVGDGYYALASEVGNIETALDAILAMQESLIGGDA